MHRLLRRLKSLLTALCFLGLSAISLASAIQVIRTGVPDGHDLDHAAVRAALIDPALPQRDSYQRLRLARQLEDELLAGADWETELASLPEPERGTAEANFADLLAMLLWRKVQVYHALPEHRRERYLDRQLEDLMSWRQAMQRDSGDRPQMNLPAEMLTRQLSAALRDPDVTPEQRRQLQQFAVDLQRRWITQGLQKIMPR